MEAGALQGANGFKSAENADGSVVGAGVGNGVDVGAGGDGREVRLGAMPASEGVADGVFGDGEPGFFAKVLDVFAGAQVGLIEDHARDDRRLVLRDERKRGEFIA